MFDIANTCGTCKYAEFWDRTKGGKLRDNRGKCAFPVDEALIFQMLPWSVRPYPVFRKQMVWQNDGKGCTKYEITEDKDRSVK